MLFFLFFSLTFTYHYVVFFVLIWIQFCLYKPLYISFELLFSIFRSVFASLQYLLQLFHLIPLDFHYSAIWFIFTILYLFICRSLPCLLRCSFVSPKSRYLLRCSFVSRSLRVLVLLRKYLITWPSVWPWWRPFRSRVIMWSKWNQYEVEKDIWSPYRSPTQHPILL